MPREKQEHRMRRERRERWKRSGMSWYDFMSRGHRKRRARRQARIPQKPMPKPRVHRGTSHVGTSRGRFLLHVDTRFLRFDTVELRRAYEMAMLL